MHCHWIFLYCQSISYWKSQQTYHTYLIVIGWRFMVSDAKLLTPKLYCFSMFSLNWRGMLLLVSSAVVVSNTLVIIEGTRARCRKISSEAAKKAGTSSRIQGNFKTTGNVSFLNKRAISMFQLPFSSLTTCECKRWTENYFKNEAASSICLYFGHTSCCYILWVQGTFMAQWLDEWSGWTKTKIF